jgi:hypothetical protein
MSATSEALGMLRTRSRRLTILEEQSLATRELIRTPFPALHRRDPVTVQAVAPDARSAACANAELDIPEGRS